MKHRVTQVVQTIALKYQANCTGTDIMNINEA